MRHLLMPLIMGLCMGPIMLWMMHGAIIDDAALSIWALMIFVSIHLVLIAVVIGAGVFAARLSTSFKRWIDHLHRPRLWHVAVMLGGAVISASAVHLITHRGI